MSAGHNVSSGSGLSVLSQASSSATVMVTASRATPATASLARRARRRAGMNPWWLIGCLTMRRRRRGAPARVPIAARSGRPCRAQG
jgi:hypothetical protein